jgi:hypothetical protein
VQIQKPAGKLHIAYCEGEASCTCACAFYRPTLYRHFSCFLLHGPSGSKPIIIMDNMSEPILRTKNGEGAL